MVVVPAVAMRFTNEVRWDTADFILLGGMLIAACLAFETVAAATGKLKYRSLWGLAIVATFLLVWIELAVGIVGPG